MTHVVVVGCALVGAALGPVLNLVIERSAERRPIQPFHYRRPRGWREWAVVAASSALFGVAAARFGASWHLPGYLLLFGTLLALSVIDLRVSRLPDRLTLPTLAASLVIVAAASAGDGESSRIWHALVGMVAYFVAVYVPHVVYPKGMGRGDVKLAGLMGLYLGWLAPDWWGAVYLVLLALIAGCLFGLPLGLSFNIARRRRGAFPIGPALALACVAVVLSSPSLLDGMYVR